MKTKFACVAAAVALSVAGCESRPNPDVAAARAYVRSCYSAAISLDLTLDEQPEYAAIPKIPRERLAKWVPDRPAACGVRVRLVWRDEGRTTHDDWMVWVGGDHKAVAWSSNTAGDNWRPYVQSLARR